MPERRFWEKPRKAEPSGTARALSLMVRQCCMHQLVVKCVQDQSCTCRAAKRPCTSVFTSDYYSQKGTYPDSLPWGEAAGPYWFKAHKQDETKHHWGPWNLSNPLSFHPPGIFSPRRPVVLTQHPHGRRGVGRWNLPCDPSAYLDRRPWYRHTRGYWEWQNKLKLRTTNGRSKRVN